MKFHDITRILNHDIPIFPGDPEYKIETFEQGCFNISKISMGSHTGTHIDAPKHLFSLENDVDSIPLESLIGKCMVLDVSGCEKQSLITSEMIKQGLGRINRTFPGRILFKTLGNLEGISIDACVMLETMGLKLIGIDLISIEKELDAMPVHNFLLTNNVPIIEFLDLENVFEGIYNLIALPLRLKDADASPCRVILTS